MRLLISICFALAFVCLWCSVAIAGGGDSWAGDAGNQAINVVGVALGGVLTYFLGRLIKIAEKKIGIDIPEREERLLEQYVRDGVGMAEEQAHRLIKLGNKPPSGEAKESMATDSAEARAAQAGFQKVTRAVIKAKVAAEVNRHRNAPKALRPPTLPPA